MGKSYYQYVAYNEAGGVVKGKLSAAGEDAASELLGYAGYRAISLKLVVPFFNPDKLLAALFRPKATEIILFYRELAMLLESGINIVTALELLMNQVTNRTLKRALGEAIADLHNGSQLSAALGKHTGVFSPIYCRLVGIGEQSGHLETVLRQIADYMEKEATANKNIKNALMLPVITSLATIVVVTILATFVLPAFANLYSMLGVELPTPARITIGIAGKIQKYGIYLVLALVVAVVLAFLYVRTPGGRYKWDKLLLSLPLVGRVNHLGELARCCRSLSLLFQAGLPLAEAMPLVTHGGANRALVKALMDVHQDMVKGEGLSQPMAKNRLFLPMMVQLVKVGEETGKLDVTLLAVSRGYEAEAEDRTRSIIAQIQPAMTLAMGLVIGLIAWTLTSAMYSMYGQGF
ncbi:MAG: type II secretion system F family protein [Chloroflexi bacterium]|nr:type II secretion system F family protein [Chloroflexota bacterium]